VKWVRIKGFWLAVLAFFGLFMITSIVIAYFFDEELAVLVFTVLLIPYLILGFMAYYQSAK
jgi:hypothetical protein